ncbi:hypothetical protein H5410_017519 [Solanum commersonii]|uniref:Uncharacterized protein n=1 Tax=Solanum commersonii TaxID=4109 RepID=A0A9J6A0P9_SOLCO|nr:hypothetical protein H5410_017519 [Solanum commersonii]
MRLHQSSWLLNWSSQLLLTEFDSYSVTSLITMSPDRVAEELDRGINNGEIVRGWGRKTDSSQSDHGVPGLSNSSKLISQAELEVKQLLKGCTFTKDQYDHILKGFQYKTDIASLDCNATLVAAHTAIMYPRAHTQTYFKY